MGEPGPSDNWVEELRQSAYTSETSVIEDYKTQPRTLNDVKSLVTNFVRLNGLTEKADMTIELDGKSYKSKVQYSNIRTKILTALTAIQSVLEHQKGNALKPIIDISKHGTQSIDEMISNELFAKRDGSRVYWDVKEGRVYYDFQTGKLSIVTGNDI